MGKVGVVGGNPDMWIKKLERKNLVFDPLHAEIIGYDDEDEGAEQEENDMEDYPGEVEEYPDEVAEAAEETYPDYPEEEEYPEGAYPEDSYETYPEESYPYPEDSGMQFAPFAPQGPDPTAGQGYNYPYPPPIQLPPELYSTPPVFPPSPPDPVPTGQLTGLASIVAKSAENFQQKLVAKDPAAISTFTNLIKAANSNPVAKQVLKIVEKPFVPPTPPAPSGGGLASLFKTPVKPPPPPAPKPTGLVSMFKAPVKPPPPPAPSGGGLSSLFKAPIPPAPKPGIKLPLPVKPVPLLPPVPSAFLKPKLSIRGDVVMGGQVTSALSGIIKTVLSPVVWVTHGAGTMSKGVGNVLESLARKL